MATGVATSPRDPSKAVRIYVNGNPFFNSRKFVINPRQIRNFDSFLAQVTSGVKASYGAVRNVYTPRYGHKVANLDSLENGNSYVVGGTERFKRIPYTEIENRPKPRPRFQPDSVKPVVHNRHFQVSAKFRKVSTEPCIIYVHRNGDDKNPAIKLLLQRRVLSDWEQVMTIITERANLTTGAVRRLYHMDGTQVKTLSELGNGKYYVAAGGGPDGRFRKVKYSEALSSVASSPRSTKSLPPIKTRPFRTNKFESRYAYARKALQDGGGSQVPLKQERKPLPPVVKKSKKSSSPKTKEQEEAESIFHSKPTAHKRSSEKERPGYSENNNGVFKAKEESKETKGAAEVVEDNRTAVDLPIDQVEATEVEEEIRPPSPAKQRSPSPEVQRSPFPRRSTPPPTLASVVNGRSSPSPSPERKRSPSPETKRSPSPPRRSPSPPRRSPSPETKRSPSPETKRSPSPETKRSPSPPQSRQRTPSPELKRSSPSPVEKMMVTTPPQTPKKQTSEEEEEEKKSSSEDDQVAVGNGEELEVEPKQLSAGSNGRSHSAPPVADDNSGEPASPPADAQRRESSPFPDEAITNLPPPLSDSPPLNDNTDIIPPSENNQSAISTEDTKDNEVPTTTPDTTTLEDNRPSSPTTNDADQAEPTAASAAAAVSEETEPENEPEKEPEEARSEKEPEEAGSEKELGSVANEAVPAEDEEKSATTSPTNASPPPPAKEDNTRDGKTEDDRDGAVDSDDKQKEVVDQAPPADGKHGERGEMEADQQLFY